MLQRSRRLLRRAAHDVATRVVEATVVVDTAAAAAASPVSSAEALTGTTTDVLPKDLYSLKIISRGWALSARFDDYNDDKNDRTASLFEA